jgi:hypothetical protein
MRREAATQCTSYIVPTFAVYGKDPPEGTCIARRCWTSGCAAEVSSSTLPESFPPGRWLGDGDQLRLLIYTWLRSTSSFGYGCRYTCWCTHSGTG